MTQKNTPFRKFKHFHFSEISRDVPSVTLMVEESETDAKAWFVSWAVCNPVDQFCRKTGRDIAIRSWEERGYTVLLDHDWQDPIKAAIALIMTSKTTKRDRDVQIVRDALSNYITEEDTEELSGYYKMLSLAYEKTGVFVRTIENLSRAMTR